MNRDQAVYEAACSDAGDKRDEYPDFGVGLEGGLEKLQYNMPSTMNRHERTESTKKTRRVMVHGMDGNFGKQ